MANKALDLTDFSLRSKSAGELDRYILYRILAGGN